MLCRTAAARSLLRAFPSRGTAASRSGVISAVFKAQLTTSSSQRQGGLPKRSPSLALSPYRQPVTTALIRSYASNTPAVKHGQPDEEDIDMMAGVKSDVAVIKDTFSLRDVPKDALYLGLAGVVPYLVTSVETAYLSWEMSNALTTGSGKYISAETAEAFMSVLEPMQIGYGAVILSFLGAVHWGMEWAGYGGKVGFRRYAPGVIAPAIAWPTLLLPTEYALITQFFAFTFLYYNDARAAVKGWVPYWYHMYRFVLTFVVGASIVFTLIGRGQLESHFDFQQRTSEKLKALRVLTEQQSEPAVEAVEEEKEEE